MEYPDKKKIIIAVLFAVFLFLRTFSSSPSALLGADNLKYMETAKSFPYHKLYNHQLYLLHPPFYPYTIYFVNLIFKDYNLSVIFISLFSSVITFFILYKFFMMLTRKFSIVFFVLLFYTLSVPFISSAKASLKESFVLMLIFLSLYYYVKGVKFNDKKLIIAASLVGVILAFTSDHVVLLFPSLVLSYIIFNSIGINLKNLSFPNLKYAIIPIVIILVAYGSWSYIKLVQYSTNEYYPNGVGGMPLSTQSLNLFKIISPTNFEDFNNPYTSPGAVSVIKKIVFQLGYMFNIEPFSIPLGLNLTTMSFLLSAKHIAYMLFIYLPLSLIALFGFFHIIKDSIKMRKIYGNSNLYIIGLFLIFLFPLTQPMVSPRFIFTAYIFLFCFISYGLFALLIHKKMLKIYSNLIPAIVILLLLLIPFWYYHNPYFVLSVKPVFLAQNTANFINENIGKEDAIMAQPGYTVNLIYLTERRVVGLYHKPEKIADLIDYYNIKYVVVGKIYTLYVGKYGVESVEYIKSNPDKFELIATLKEDYSNFYGKDDPARNDEVYIYKVKRDRSN